MMLSIPVVVDKVPSNFIITFPEIGIVNVCEKKVQEFTATLLVVAIIELSITILISGNVIVKIEGTLSTTTGIDNIIVV